MDEETYEVAQEIFNYAKSIASQRSGLSLDVVSPTQEDFDLAIQFHKLVAQVGNQG